MSWFKKKKPRAPIVWRFVVMRTQVEGDGLGSYGGVFVKGFEDDVAATDYARQLTEANGGSRAVYQRLYDIHPASDVKVVL